jgi:hypothetical protein
VEHESCIRPYYDFIFINFKNLTKVKNKVLFHKHAHSMLFDHFWRHILNNHMEFFDTKGFCCIPVFLSLILVHSMGVCAQTHSSDFEMNFQSLQSTPKHCTHINKVVCKKTRLRFYETCFFKQGISSSAEMLYAWSYTSTSPYISIE